jgi:hypothetical protein
MLDLTTKSERKQASGPSSGILPQLGLSGKRTERQRQYRHRGCSTLQPSQPER